MLTAHKIRIYPNNKQLTQLIKSCGVARFSYNWGLGEWNRQYEAGGKPNEAALRKELNAIKKTAYPWMYEVSKCCVQESIINLGVAWNNFFRTIEENKKLPKKQRKKAHPPVFKKKGIDDFFTIDSNQDRNFKISGKTITLPHIGKIRMAEPLRFKANRLIAATISRQADHWYVSIQLETDDPAPKPPTGKVEGSDLGCHAHVSTEKSYIVPRSYRKNQRKLRRAQKSLDRKEKGGKNREKQKLKVAKLHQRIANIRKDFIHKTTTDLINKNDINCIETLNVKGMAKVPTFAKSIHDAGFGEFARQMKYKSERYGRTLVLASRWFPSSKLCSSCFAKTKQDMNVKVRSWTCEHCGAQHDRDLNAAKNLKILALYLTNPTAVSLPVAACREFFASGGEIYKVTIKRPRKSRIPRKKQELKPNQSALV